MPRKRHLVDELIDRARQLKLINPYFLHGDKILREFDARHLPIVIIDSDGKLRYLNESDVLRTLEFEAYESITVETLKKCSIASVSIFDIFNQILSGYTGGKLDYKLTDDHESADIVDIFTQNDKSPLYYTTDSLSFLDSAYIGEAIYHLGSFLATYEKYFKYKHKAVHDVKSISDAILKAVPIYIFGIPRALVVCPNIAELELTMMMSTITMGLERLFWDVFSIKTAACIQNKMTVSDAIIENLDVLLPNCDWKLLGFSSRDSDIKISNSVTLKVEFPIIEGELSRDLQTQQENLSGRVRSYCGTWNAIREAIINEAVTAAIIKIMARNGSHNLGSHALGHLATYFDGNARTTPKYEAGVGKFLRYIQKRMDFMTQIATAPPTWCLNLPWTIGTNALNPVENNATTGKRDLKANMDSISYAVLSDFQNQYCLLDTIVQSDNVRLAPETGDSQLRFDVSIDSQRTESNQIAPEEQQNQEKHSNPIVFVGVPHGQIGAHALYSILENLLRNAAKYGKNPNGDKRGEEPLTISVVLREEWPSDAPQARHATWMNEYFQVEISDSGSGANAEVVAQINRYLGENILDRETAELLAGQWGMKEIKICAAYLRMVRQENIDRSFEDWRIESKGKQPPIVEARLLNPREVEAGVTDNLPENYVVDEKGRKRLKKLKKTVGNLGYVFYLLQPKEALIIGSPLTQSHEMDNKQRVRFQRAGFDFLSFAELQARLERGGQPLRHQFAVLHADVMKEKSWQWLARHIGALPCRLLVCGAKGLDSVPAQARVEIEKVAFFEERVPDFATPDHWRRWLWETWVRALTPDLEIVVRWQIPADASVPDTISFVDQDNKATRELKRPQALVFDHAPSPHQASGQDSVGEALYSSSRFHESIGGAHPAKSMFLKAQQESANNGQLETDTLVFLMQLRETAAAKIAVLDERIFARRNETSVGGTSRALSGQTFGQSWEKRRLYLLDHEAAEQSFIELPLKGLEGNERYDVLVVHQGVIDKLRDNLSTADYQTGWARLKGRARFVVVDTGRGKPETARDENLRWLEYSNLSESVFRGSKLDVASLLFALRAETGAVGPSAGQARF